MKSSSTVLTLANVDGRLLSTMDMQLSDGQRMLFSLLLPMNPARTIHATELETLQLAHQLIGGMLQSTQGGQQSPQ